MPEYNEEKPLYKVFADIHDRLDSVIERLEEIEKEIDSVDPEEFVPERKYIVANPHGAIWTEFSEGDIVQTRHHDHYDDSWGVERLSDGYYQWIMPEQLRKYREDE